jgi:hypothetical protein
MDPTADLWIDSNVVGEVIPPPVTSRGPTLPFDKLSWENFERLCYRLAWRIGEVSDCRRYGVQGQNQKGIDIYVRRSSDGNYVTWQCKRHEVFGPSDIENAVTIFLENSWASRSKAFILAVTVDLSPTALAETVITQTQRCSLRGINFEPLDRDHLSLLLKAHPDLVDDFFGRTWVTDFCGADAAARLDARLLSKEQRVRAREKLCDLYAIHFASVDAGLPAVAGALGDGDTPFPLHKRYIFPKAEAVTTVTQVNAEPTKPKLSSVKTEEEDGKQDNKTKGGYFGFRAIEHRTNTELFEWLTTIHRAVIIGDTGLGKSASLRFIALDLLLGQPRNESLARAWGNYLPIFIPFAVITRFVNAGNNGTILDYVKIWMKELDASAETLDLLELALKDERVLLLVDGLDEWTDAITASTAMTKLLGFVESRKLPVIATSRPIGHQRISEFVPNWKRADLLHFDSEQQRLFTCAWFEHYHTISLPSGSASTASLAANRETNSFMAEIGQDPALVELAGIPLLLSALICLRLRGQVLPRNKYDALEAICKTLIQEQPQRRARSALQNRELVPHQSGMAERGIPFLAHFIMASPNSTAIKKEDARVALANFYRTDLQKSEGNAYELATFQVDRAANEIGILVESESGMLGFLHRNLQEYLAAKYVKRLPLVETRKFILEKLILTGWQETVLALLSLLDRKDEVDGILKEIQATTFSPLYVPGVKLFLARVAFRDFNCSIGLAKDLAKETFSLIEQSPWMPIREALLREAVRGLDSEILRDEVRGHLKKWFPCRVRWRSEIIGHLQKQPTSELGRILLRCLYNSDSPHEKRDIAIALSKCAFLSPEIANDLSTLFVGAGEVDLLGASLHALALGWPDHPSLSFFLEQAVRSSAASLKCIALIHQARRGNTAVEIKRQLSQFCNARSRIYPWDDDVLKTLEECWPQDVELRKIALESVHNRFFPTEWNDRVALKFLVETFPQDDDVAEIIAELLKKADHISTEFDHAVKWEILISNFSGHPKIVPVAEEWLTKHIDQPHDDFSLVQVAKLARTPLTRSLLYGRFRKGTMQPRWLVNTILHLNGGAWDPELLETLALIAQEPKKAISVADYLPKLADVEGSRKLLISLLETGESFQIGFVFDGLAHMEALSSPEVTEIWKKRLATDEEGVFWYGARYDLLKHFGDVSEVRAAAMRALDMPDYGYSPLIDAFGNDPKSRSDFENLLEPLSEQLRLALVKELERFSLRNDSFALELLAGYRRESNPEVKTAASRSYYGAIKKFDPDHSPHIKKLIAEMTTRGMDFDFHRQAAVAGLLILGHAKGLLDESLKKEGGEFPVFSIHAEGDVNWEFVRTVIESWDALVEVCGPGIWKRFHGVDVLVQQLFRAGRRHEALMILSDRLEDIRRQASMDRDSFVALSLLEGHQPSFKAFCVDLFNKLVPVAGTQGSMSWTYTDTELQLEAAHYVAKHYPGDPELGTALVRAAKLSHEPSGPLVALCYGWPNEPYLAELWNGLNHQQFNESPPSAWLTTLFASAAEFARYVASLPASFQNAAAWRFPRESVFAVRTRLARDTEARQELLALLTASEDGDIIASTCRLLGITAQDTLTLCNWGAKEIESLRIRSVGQLQPVGYDMMTGQVRSLEFSIMDACLTK